MGRQALANILCCLCGRSIQPNGANMCGPCLQEEVDVTEGIPRTGLKMIQASDSRSVQVNICITHGYAGGGICFCHWWIVEMVRELIVSAESIISIDFIHIAFCILQLSLHLKVPNGAVHNITDSKFHPCTLGMLISI
ncbi:unnamed protein product [Choristocarpus tenellus]